MQKHRSVLERFGFGKTVDECSAPPRKGGPPYPQVLRAARTRNIDSAVRRKRQLCLQLAASTNVAAIETSGAPGAIVDTIEVEQRLCTFEADLQVPALIYKRGTLERPPATPAAMTRRNTLVWFALTSGRTAYGPIVATYRLRKRPRLIDIGRSEARDLIAQLAVAERHATELYVRRVFNPDYQWSGGAANADTTAVMRSVLEPLGYDGTWIDANADEALQGAEELVLWRRFAQLLHKY